MGRGEQGLELPANTKEEGENEPDLTMKKNLKKTWTERSPTKPLSGSKMISLF